MRKKDDREECYALCHIFGVRFKCCVTYGASFRMRHWVHQLWSVNEQGSVMRQMTIQDCNVEAWRAAIKRLLSSNPPRIW